jgi:hypothetical protein
VRFWVGPEYCPPFGWLLNRSLIPAFLRTSVLVLRSTQVKTPAKMRVGRIGSSNPSRSSGRANHLAVLTTGIDPRSTSAVRFRPWAPFPLLIAARTSSGLLTFRVPSTACAISAKQVHSPLPAKVLEVGYNKDAGNYVRLKSTEKWIVGSKECFVWFMVMHLEHALVKAGNVLGVGDPIGASDGTGFSTGPHVHISYRRVDEYNTQLDTDPATDFTFDPHPDWTGIRAQDFGTIIGLYQQARRRLTPPSPRANGLFGFREAPTFATPIFTPNMESAETFASRYSGCFDMDKSGITYRTATAADVDDILTIFGGSRARSADESFATNERIGGRLGKGCFVGRDRRRREDRRICAY